MSKNAITYRDLSDGDIEICRDLCNALMQHQASKGIIHPEILGNMNFDNRLKPSFTSAGEKLLIVAFDDEAPIGYIFADVTTITEGSKAFRPAWKSLLNEEEAAGLGFFPADIEVPTKAGEINNLYVKPEYRGENIGKELTDRAMAWIKSHEDVHCAFVDVSNGNNAASFYEKYGFTYSHDVMGGIIKAYIAKF